MNSTEHCKGGVKWANLWFPVTTHELCKQNMNVKRERENNSLTFAYKKKKLVTKTKTKRLGATGNNSWWTERRLRLICNQIEFQSMKRGPLAAFLDEVCPKKRSTKTSQAWSYSKTNTKKQLLAQIWYLWCFLRGRWKDLCLQKTFLWSLYKNF